MWATEDGSDTMRSCVVDFRVNFGSTPLGHMLIAGENSCDRKEDYEKSEMESKQKQAAKKNQPSEFGGETTLLSKYSRREHKGGGYLCPSA